MLKFAMVPPTASASVRRAELVQGPLYEESEPETNVVQQMATPPAAR